MADITKVKKKPCSGKRVAQNTSLDHIYGTEYFAKFIGNSFVIALPALITSNGALQNDTDKRNQAERKKTTTPIKTENEDICPKSI